MVCCFDTEIARPAVNGQPAFSGFGILSILNEMIASAECADTFVK